MRFIDSLESVGQYAVLMKSTLTLPDRFREFIKEFFKEMYKLGVNSIWIVMVISLFIGAVMVMQIALNVASPLLPRFTVGAVSREIILLEFSSTIMCLILAGKVGSNIASEIGTMRVTEQIDALEIMGPEPPPEITTTLPGSLRVLRPTQLGSMCTSTRSGCAAPNPCSVSTTTS